MFNFSATPPLSLYIHIPWCVKKCPYCDFNSHELHDDIPERQYIDALIADLEQDLPSAWGRTVETVFIGGGTPSLLSPDAIDRLLSDIRARIPLKPDAEITLEANPGTVDRQRFQGFRDAGINRLSIGIQSFQDDLLQQIGRIHNGSEATSAVEAAQHAGFDNINLDLMFGLPGQTKTQACADLQTAMQLQPTHLSWYELTIEPNTWFHRHPPERPGDDALWNMQQAGQTLLAEGGYARYEVSAYAHDNRQCRHNLNYWNFGDYLGIGAGAHAKLTDAASQSILRTTKQRHPHSYLETAGSEQRISSRQTPGTDDVVFEFAMNALRLENGFSRETFAAHTGLPADVIDATIKASLDEGLLVDGDETIRASEQGRRYLNELLQLWMPEASGHAETG
jgi:oxygen-independent coproporphyrinogen-3 oxidase